MSAALSAPRPGRPYDRAARNRAVRRSRYRGVYVYIPEVELQAAGIDPNEPIYYRLRGHQRSRNAHAVMIDLYREP